MEAAGPRVPLAMVDHDAVVGLPGIPVGNENKKPNAAIESLKDIVFGSVSFSCDLICCLLRGTQFADGDTRLRALQENSSNTLLIRSKCAFSHNPTVFPSATKVRSIASASRSSLMGSAASTVGSVRQCWEQPSRTAVCSSAIV